jgi:hypothetical protein
MVLSLASADALTLTLISQRRGLPPAGQKLLRARGPDAVPSQSGDLTLLMTKLDVPSR